MSDKGNTLVVVEHDEDTIRAADHIIDIGPSAGKRGGRLVAQGSVADVQNAPESQTGRYLVACDEASFGCCGGGWFRYAESLVLAAAEAGTPGASYARFATRNRHPAHRPPPRVWVPSRLRN